jgi:dipeptidyl aminopeptidase/acylaminoacyl peptidase
MRHHLHFTLLVAALLALATALPTAAPGPQTTGRIPTVDDLLNLKSAGGPQISPDGKWVAYTVTATDWKQDAFVTHIWLAEVATGRTFQLTRGEKSCSNPTWSPDSAWLAFSSARIEGKPQVFVIRPDGGEAIQLTKTENGAGGFEWAPDGKQIAYTTSNLNDKDVKARKDYLGDFEVVRKEYGYQHIWTFDVIEALASPVTGKERTKGKEFSVS